MHIRQQNILKINNMEQKKATNGQLQKRINNAELIIDKGKGYKHIDFDDLGIHISICEDFVVLSTNFHHHVWNKVVSNNRAETCVMLDSLVDIALLHKEEIKDKDGRGNVFYSFDKLKNLSNLEDSEKTIVLMFETWVYVLETNVHSLSNDMVDYVTNQIKYLAWHALNTSIFNLADSDKDTSFNDVVDDYLSNEAYFMCGIGIDDDKRGLAINETKDVMVDALNKVREINKKYGANVDSFVVLKKRDDSEIEAMSELIG